jgi:putative hemolysin
MAIILALLVMLFFLLLAGLFEGSELALISCDRVRLTELAEQGSGRARTALHLLRQPERLLSTTLMVSNSSIVVVSALAEWLANSYLPAHWAMLVSTIGITLLVLVFSQLLPKSWGLAKCDSLSLNTSYPLRLLSLLFTPLIWFAERVSRAILRLFLTTDKITPYISRQEMQMMVARARDASRLHHQIGLMVEHIFAFSELKLTDIMVPVQELSTLPLHSRVSDAVNLITEKGYSRLPIYQEERENIVGVVVADDLLDLEGTSELLALVRIPQVVDKEESSEYALKLLRENSLGIAFVVDQRLDSASRVGVGKVIGMITLEDLVEEIVGDIWDEYDF